MTPHLVQLILYAVATATWLVMCASSCAADKQFMTRTFTYKTVDDLPIKLDVHRADDEVRRPVVVWIHGGALIVGHRAGINQRVKNSLLDAGYAIVSIDYRLAPETKLPAIIADLEDAFAWLRQRGPKLFNVDFQKYSSPTA